MSEILDILNATGTVYRLRGTDVNNNKQEYYSFATGVAVRLESISDSDVMYAQGDLTKTFKVYAAVGAFRESDKLVINSTTYYVEGVRTFNQEYGAHLEAIVHETRALDA